MKKNLLLALAICAVASCATVFAVGCSDGASGTHTNHSYVKKVTEAIYLKSEATCTKKAVYYYSCSCGEKGTETFEVGEANGHMFDQAVTEEQYLKSQATCTKKAVYYYSCSNCGERGTVTFEFGEVDKVNGHNYVEGKCAICEKDQPPSEDLYYELNSDGTGYFVAGRSTAINNTNVKIASTYGKDNLPVISISDYAFADFSSLTSISIPNSVTSIGSDAFKNCSSLTSIVIPNSVTNIGERAFKDCRNLVNITISNSLTIIENQVFSNCNSLSSIIIPNSVTRIGYGAFDNCSSITNIRIPNSVTNIGLAAFESCKGLTIYCEAENQPNGWNEIFNYDCPVVWNCKNNDVANDGYIYFVEDGIRYALKDEIAKVAQQPLNLKDDLIIKETVTYKNSIYAVTTIDSHAFSNCSRLTSITIPDNITTIGVAAFNRCSGLTSIIIPYSVTNIGVGAFGGCSNLTIYCVAESQPAGWEQNWNFDRYNGSSGPVIWGYKGE